jgi:hypothetical protein
LTVIATDVVYLPTNEDNLAPVEAMMSDDDAVLTARTGNIDGMCVGPAPPTTTAAIDVVPEGGGITSDGGVILHGRSDDTVPAEVSIPASVSTAEESSTAELESDENNFIAADVLSVIDVHDNVADPQKNGGIHAFDGDRRSLTVLLLMVFFFHFPSTLMLLSFFLLVRMEMHTCATWRYNTH